MAANNRIDLIGKRFGRLTVLSYSHKDKRHRLFWLCICDCGNKTTPRGDLLKSGGTKSCGCFNRELIKERAAQRRLGGRVKDERLYGIWSGIKQRCFDVGCTEYHRYGARGINVCDDWKNDYQKFKEWALENGYSSKLSIDRIDVNGNYTPENCKWSTPKEQANNRRNSIRVTYKNKTRTLAEWSEVLNMNYSCLYGRIKGGWEIELAFTKPSKPSTNTNTSEENK